MESGNAGKIFEIVIYSKSHATSIEKVALTLSNQYGELGVVLQRSMILIRPSKKALNN